MSLYNQTYINYSLGIKFIPVFIFNSIQISYVLHIGNFSGLNFLLTSLLDMFLFGLLVHSGIIYPIRLCSELSLCAWSHMTICFLFCICMHMHMSICPQPLCCVIGAVLGHIICSEMLLMLMRSHFICEVIWYLLCFLYI